ncbi:MAG TPA: hypothetical protein VGM62_06015 [Chthoniobacterales bacterium]|jgi:hypothetical protein
MNTDQTLYPQAFLQAVSDAVSHLKIRLQHDYEQAYPPLREIIHLVLDEEESRAWELSLFPHLLLPDLVEAHIANLNLQPVETKHEDLARSRGFDQFPIFQPAYALCG